jgi:hypothetical protein
MTSVATSSCSNEFGDVLRVIGIEGSGNYGGAPARSWSFFHDLTP